MFLVPTSLMGKVLSQLKCSGIAMPPAGLEPATVNLEGCCSNPLSYGGNILITGDYYLLDCIIELNVKSIASANHQAGRIPL